MVKATINGKTAEFSDGISILHAAREIGIDIPTLCHDERLKPAGACRLCLVHVKGEVNDTASCMRQVTEGMEVETHSPRIEHARKMNLRMLAKDYPREAFEAFPEKPFHMLAEGYGLSSGDFSALPLNGGRDTSHTYIDVDMSRCVDCYRCVRICNEVQGQFVWQTVGRGEDTHIVPDSFDTFAASTCVSCGACADTCPTGAIEDKSFARFGSPDAWTRTVCSYCGTGCEMAVGTKNGRVIQVKPVADAPVNHGHLCVKGRYAYKFVHSNDRATEPMIRRMGAWEVVPWPEAIAFIADNLKRIAAENGPESIAVLGSARATNEENYVAQKFVRVVLGTNNVDCCARVCHTPTAAAMKMMLGTGAATNSFADIEKAKTIMVCGANPNENHPIPGARMKQAVIKGANLIVIDPRKTEIAKYADIHLQLRPGTNVPLLNAIAYTIIEEGLADEEFISKRVDEYEKFRNFVSDYSPEAVREACGVDAELIRRAARMYATAKPAMCFHGLGVTEHTQGTEGVMCLVNLALLTGNMGKPGTGINPLRGQNNVQGSAQMGCDPGILTGSIAILDGKEHFEKIWGAPVPVSKGLDQLQMVDAARDGKLKALWSIGYDVVFSNANANETERAFDNLELCIVQDLFLNETAKGFAHVFLPAASSFEKDGTFMNAERRVQRIRKSIEPLGNSRTDWEIVCDVARAMGKGEYFGFTSAEDIWNEVRLVWPNSFGISYERIEHHGLQWNCPSLDHPGTDVLHAESFALGERAALRRIKYRPTPEIESDEFPFIMNTGRSLYHFNAGTMSRRTENSRIRPSDTLDISPVDADRLSLDDGEQVRLVSKYGEAVIPIAVKSNVKPGELFATFHEPGIFLNRVTSANRDKYTHAPEYKVTAVRIEKLI
ncbi:MAG: formate dehydrogenase subunit alpha [Pyrinomonadaceae bacterium]|nr:formate dehydrogenase subunit alpha [Pyrinomonadaceae bacterium]